MAVIPQIPDVFVGHATRASERTGCTVILCPAGATGGVAVRGAAPGTRETDLLHPGNLVDQVHAVLLTGGSAFGLAAADGIMRWLHERGHGFPTGIVNVPIVPAAVLFDLGVGAVAWPDAALGYAACEAAQSSMPVQWGRIGAGTGATVGKALGLDRSSPGGVGYASMTLADSTVVAAVVAVNGLGHVVDPATNTIIAGPRLDDGVFADSVQLMLQGSIPTPIGTNTTIGCIITTAHLDKAACCRIASMAHDGLARTIRPVHTQFDGDTLFVLSTAATTLPAANPTLIGVAASEVVAQAILNAVKPAT